MRRCFQAFHFRRLFKNDLAMSSCLIFWHVHPTFATKKPYCIVNIGIYPSQISFQISSLGWSTHLPGFARVLIAKSRQLCEQPKLGTLKNQLSKSEKLVKHYPNTHTQCFCYCCGLCLFLFRLHRKNVKIQESLFVLSPNLNWQISALKCFNRGFKSIAIIP